MKKILLSFVCAFTVSVLLAQPNFTSADMPNIGDFDTVRYLVYQPIDNNLTTETGNGYTWDFSFLPFSTYPNFVTTVSFREKTNPVSTPFVDATIEEYVYDGTAGDVNLFDYSHDTLYLYRSGSVVSGLQLPIPIATAVFPIQFNDSSKVTSNFYVGSTVVGQRTTTLRYDGFGTLKMPGNKTYTNVFRIKKVEKDTSYVVNSTISYISYIWYKQGGQVPLLRLTYTGALNLYFVFGSKSNNSSTPTAITALDEMDEINVYPNPTTGQLTIAGLNEVPYKVSLYDGRGTCVLQQRSTSTLDLSGMAKGVYFLNISTGNKTITRKMVLQ
jgi:hypothetical protein